MILSKPASSLKYPAHQVPQHQGPKVSQDTLLLPGIQIGYSTIADEIEVLMPFLRRPYVHLAIDSEYDRASRQISGQQVGASYATEIAGAAQALSYSLSRKVSGPRRSLFTDSSTA